MSGGDTARIPLYFERVALSLKSYRTNRLALMRLVHLAFIRKTESAQKIEAVVARLREPALTSFACWVLQVITAYRGPRPARFALEKFKNGAKF